jgi:hypothetical protein
MVMAEQKTDPNKGVQKAVQAEHEARVSGDGDTVDARLDNRTGADRPKVETYPAKPQQVDGPDVMHQVEHTRRTLADRQKAVGKRKGMFSPGPHGISDEKLREAQAPVFGTEGVKGE